MVQRILVRADGRLESGLGHVIRMLALAEMLSEIVAVDFICEETVPSSVRKELEGVVRELFLIPPIQGNGACLKAMEPILANYKVVIIDQYQNPEALVARARSAGCKAVRIVDEHEVSTSAELCLGHSLQEPSTKNKSQMRAHGFEYALIRKAFYDLPPHAVTPKCFDALVSFGGLDPLNSTLKLLESLAAIAEVRRILVVTGGAYPHREALDEYRKSSDTQNIHVVSGVSGKEFAQYIQSSDFCITPASGTALEVAAVGAGLCIGLTSNDQQCLFNQMLDRELAHGLGDLRTQQVPELRAALKKFICRSDFRKRLVENQAEIFDGHAGERLRGIIGELVYA